MTTLTTRERLLAYCLSSTILMYGVFELLVFFSH